MSDAQKPSVLAEIDKTTKEIMSRELPPLPTDSEAIARIVERERVMLLNQEIAKAQRDLEEKFAPITKLLSAFIQEEVLPVNSPKNTLFDFNAVTDVKDAFEKKGSVKFRIHGTWYSDVLEAQNL